MTTIVNQEDTITIPDWVANRAAFRRWLNSDEFPETGRICFLQGGVWVDMSKERVFSHNQVKAEYNGVLHPLIKAAKSGRWFPDGLLLGNAEADFTCQPDGTFVSHLALETGRVRLVEATKEGYLEIEGSPDMVLEVVSKSPVRKDLEIMRDLYWQAGIAEYWLVNARGKRLDFDILRHTARGYVAARKHDGWVKSAVFGKSFRLTRELDASDNPVYTLEVR
jgi:Uma2 family endonuclease